MESFGFLDHLGREEICSSVSLENVSFWPNQCPFCKQLYNDPNLISFGGDHEEALEELSLLTDPRFILISDGEKLDQRDLRPKHKVLSFAIYDGNGHLCRVDDGLIERDVELYMSGYIKPIYDDSSDLEGGNWGKRIGPINEWWISEFDGGKNVLIGVTTDSAEYVLLEPSPVYSNFWKFAWEKANLSKVVIEFLAENKDLTLAGLIVEIANFLQTKLSTSCTVAMKLAQNSLRKYGAFLVDQVVSYDNHRSDGDFVLLSKHPCFLKLNRMVTRSRLLSKAVPRRNQRRRQSLLDDSDDGDWRSKSSIVRRMRGPLHGNGFRRRRRCGICEACCLPDCGSCKNCLNMIKFGGKGLSKQACLLRRCGYMK